MHPTITREPEAFSLHQAACMGFLALACKAAMEMDPRASAVAINVEATPNGLAFDVVCSDGKQPTSGWGQ